jgi:alpha-tubulin suppressor-like RCC1 family protein
MAACQPEEGATTIPEDTTNQQDATTTASSSTPEPETFTTLTAWGYNGNGQLGNGTTTDSSTPVQVSEVGGITAIAASGAHSLAVQL